MKTLDVIISPDELQEILAGRCNVVEFAVLPEIFHTCCELVINGAKYYDMWEACKDPATAAWLKDNDYYLEPVSFDSLRLFSGEDTPPVELPIKEVYMTYLDAEDGSARYTFVDGDYHRKVTIRYVLGTK